MCYAISRARLLSAFIVIAVAGFVSLSVIGDDQSKPASPPFTPEEFAARRAKVFEAIGDDFAVFPGVDLPEGEDYRRFRQNNNFYYLSGVEQYGAVLLLDGKAKQSTLFLPGRRTGTGAEAEAKRTGLERVFDTGKFKETIAEVAEGRKRVFLLQWPDEGNAQSRDSFRSPRQPRPSFPHDRRPTRIKDFNDGVLEAAGQLEVQPLERVIDPLRRVKSPAEIAVMREAARIGAIGIADAIRSTRPGVFERELEGACEFAFLRYGAHTGAWTTIVATGPNITTFHYLSNDRHIAAEDMVLVDAGPDYHNYCSDITRVWPCSGPYPERWRSLYDKLLEVHKKTIAAVKPGITFNKLTQTLFDAAQEQGIRQHIVGGAGHYTGMSPHDVGEHNAPFVPGVVFNVEPLLVVRGEPIHIRFEDTILVTETGSECLTPLDILPWEADKLLAIRDRGKSSAKSDSTR